MIAIRNKSTSSQSSAVVSKRPNIVMQLPKSTGFNLPNKFRKLNFFPSCPNSPMPLMCAPSYIKHPDNKQTLALPSQLFNLAYVLGALAIVLNLAIILIYLYSTNIRKINSMLLISNMAFCDVLIGVYAIIIAKVNIFNVLVNHNFSSGEKLKVSKFCQVASVLFTVGQVISVITALLLTIDKFLSIVYCMDPNRKLSRRLSLLVLILCWIGVLVFAFTPHFHPAMKYSPTLMCTLPVTQMKSFVTSFCILVALYLANIPLYIKIFVFVRRSSVRMGVRRDAVLAKKIALLVFTNFIFFAAPMIVIIVFTFIQAIHYTMNINYETSNKVRFIVVYFMPVICLCFNSCLNPFLCAFRQRQFRREFKKCVRNCFLSRLCKAFTTFRPDSSSSVRTTQPTRVEMYKLSNIESQVQTL